GSRAPGQRLAPRPPGLRLHARQEEGAAAGRAHRGRHGHGERRPQHLRRARDAVGRREAERHRPDPLRRGAARPVPGAPRERRPARAEARHLVVSLLREDVRAPPQGDAAALREASVRTVDKPWGHELIWAHTDRYVGKLLHIKKGESLSLQYHRKKDETIMVL